MSLRNGGRTALSLAAERGDDPLVWTILELSNNTVNVADVAGRSPLSWAAAGGHINTAEALLEMGADSDATDSQDRTPLAWAAANGHAKMVKILLDRDDVSAVKKGIDRFTPLTLAAANGHEPVVDVLLTREEVIKDWLLQGWKEETLWDTIRVGGAMKWDFHTEVTKDVLTSRMPQVRARVNRHWAMVQKLDMYWKELFTIEP